MPALPRIGDTVDRYRVTVEIAHGGMAAVYALQRSSIGGFEKVLAMKVMLPHLATDEHFVNMFLDEARIASQIEHPNVVQVLDVGLHERMPFILMEFLRGQSLSRLVRRVRETKEPVGFHVWLDILAHAAEGLHAAHETLGQDGLPLGIVHRDVSPHNIFVGYDGHTKVVDFGIAAARGRLGGTRAGEVKGKLAYLSPEQLEYSTPVTRLTDIWALGVVAWEIFAGKRLFASRDEATAMWNVLHAPIAPIGSLAEKLPEPVARTIMASLSRDPSQRPATAREVARVYAVAAANGAHGSDTASVMEKLFGQVRAVETERLAAALREEPPPPVRERDPASDEALDRSDRSHLAIAESSGTQLSASTPKPVTKASGWRAVAIVGVVAAAVAAATWFQLGRTGRRGGTATAAPAPPPASTPAVVVSKPGSRARVSVKIDPRATLVRVDGTRHDERPLALRLGPGEAAEVEVVGPDGAVTRRTVHVRDDGLLISLDKTKPAPAPAPEKPQASKNAAPARPSRGNKSSADKSSPLLGNPF